jgi:threonine dehydratase
VDLAIGADDVLAAAEVLDGVAHRTPVFESRRLNDQLGARVLLKAESLQRTGSFKFRGAYNALSHLDASGRTNGVVAFSSGNHAQGVALASRLHGVSATIVMPIDAPASKLAATEGYGARVVTYDRYAESRDEIGADLAEREGRTLIHPYDNPYVMAGQGTAALELLTDFPEVDTLAVCVGGGGLLSGCATIAKHLSPDIEIYGVEPLAGNDHQLSRDAGERITIDVPVTIADGQQVKSPGELTWPITSELAQAFPTVTDDEIVATMRMLFEQFKLVVEPSGASALAAVVHGGVPAEGRTIGVTLSGGNVSVVRFAELVAPTA